MKKRDVKTILLITLLILIALIIIIAYFPRGNNTTGNVIYETNNNVTIGKSPGSYICDDATILYLPFDSDYKDKSQNNLESIADYIKIVKGKFYNASQFTESSSLKVPVILDKDFTLSFWLKSGKGKSNILNLVGENDSSISVSYKDRLLINQGSSAIALKDIDSEWHYLEIRVSQSEKSIKTLLDGKIIGISYIFNNLKITSLEIVNSTSSIDDLSIYLSSNHERDILDSFCISIPSCLDSDSGLNTKEKGVTITKSERREDYCLIEDTSLKYVNEYYCSQDAIVSKVMDCPNGCFNGACVA